MKTTKEINERPSCVHGRVLPVLPSTVLVYLWLEYFQCLRWKSSSSCVHGSEGGKTRAAASCGDGHPPREEESPLLHRLDFLSFGKTRLLQIIIRMDQPRANDNPVDPASCNWSSGGSGHLQMIIRGIQLLANYHTEDLASFKWSYGESNLLQMIIRRIRPLANDHPEDPASLFF